MQTQVQQMQQQSDLGRQRVEHLGKTQEKLKGSMDTITEEIRTLLDKNAKIESVTSVLYSIAKQTNLLSLNPSRLPEPGKPEEDLLMWHMKYENCRRNVIRQVRVSMHPFRRL